MFALIAGLSNLSNLFLANWVTAAWNLWFKIDEDNLEDLWKLLVVRMVFSFAPILLLWLLPSME